MRYAVHCFVLAASCVAFSQTTMASGYVTEYVPTLGAFVAPLAPLTTTPELTFETPPLQVGAENATAGNVAGASSFFPSGTLPSAPSSEAGRPAGTFNSGASIPESAYGVAQLAGKPAKAASVRKFTNDDIERLK